MVSAANPSGIAIQPFTTAFESLQSARRGFVSMFAPRFGSRPGGPAGFPGPGAATAGAGPRKYAESCRGAETVNGLGYASERRPARSR